MAQTLDKCMQIRAEAVGHRTKIVMQIVSSGTPDSFFSFYHVLKLMAELLGI